jgi:GNAT superfamily N-acetyltransferase
MRILVDTNVVIPLEPTEPEHEELGTPLAAELIGLCQGVHAVVIHPASIQELAKDSDPGRRRLRSTLLRKYGELEDPPSVDARIETELGRPAPGTNDWVDHQLLAAVARDAVDLLVTEDDGIHRKARRLGIEDRVVRVRDAVEQLRSLLGRVPPPPPFVISTRAYNLNESDSIFDSFREDYAPEFDDWLRRCKLEGRRTWVIEEVGGRDLAGICIIKEDDDELGLGGRVIKISSLKVSDRHQGNRYGELLLKTIFRFCSENRFDHAWVTVFERHAALITLLSDFGFEPLGMRTSRGEVILAKRFTPSEEERQSLGPLEFHKRFGPPALKLVPGDVFLVPIRPMYHQLLFPEVERQLEFSPRVFGNALRKAYLSKGSIRRLQPGSSLLFYRSSDLRVVTSAGVVESVLVSGDANEVARFVGQRTVYSYRQIREMCSSEVLAILFRQDRLLDAPIPIGELEANHVVKRAPQTIMTLPGEAVTWLEQRIGA